MHTIRDINNISCRESDNTALDIIKRFKPEVELNRYTDNRAGAINSIEIVNGFSESTLRSIRSQLEILIMENIASSEIPDFLYQLMRYNSEFMLAMQEISGDKWIVNKGNYCGTWLKRFNNYLYKTNNIRLSAKILSELGGYIGKLKQESDTPVNYHFDITDNFSWSSGEFGDSGSCFWQGRENAKETIRLNGGIAFRLYRQDSSGYYQGSARAWILPYRDSLLMFNGYGSELISQARILATWLGSSYAKVEFNNSDSHEMLYINSDSGYLLDSEDNIPASSERTIHADYSVLEYNGSACSDCGEYCSEDDLTYIEGYGSVCSNCLDNYTYCRECGEYHSEDDCSYIDSASGDICSDCLERYYSSCDSCGEYYRELTEVAGIELCSDCYNEQVSDCDYCGDTCLTEDMREILGLQLCSDCSDYDYAACDTCGATIRENESDTIEIAGESITYCGACFKQESSKPRAKQLEITFNEYIK